MTRVMIAIREIRSIRRNSIRNVALKKKYMSDDDFLQRRDNTRALSRFTLEVTSRARKNTIYADFDRASKHDKNFIFSCCKQTIRK